MFYTIEGKLAGITNGIENHWFECYKFPPGLCGEREARCYLSGWRINNKGFQFRLVKHTPVTDYLKEIMNV